MLQGAYKAAFGDAKMGVPGALRLGYIVHHLKTKFPVQWKEFVEQNSTDEEGKALMLYGASLGRWWSIVKSFKGIVAREQLYHNFME